MLSHRLKAVKELESALRKLRRSGIMLIAEDENLHWINSSDVKRDKSPWELLRNEDIETGMIKQKRLISSGGC